MKKLSEKQWGEFPFPKIFDIKKGFYNKRPEDSGDGNIPFLGATDSNNGVTRFLTMEAIEAGSKTGGGNNAPLSKKVFPGGAIAVTNNGSVGHAYFQATKFTCSHDINPLYPQKQKANIDISQFLIKAVEKQGELFQYARKWRPIRMVKSKIMLPTDTDGQPDYAYMESYAAGIRGELITRYRGFIKKQLAKIKYEQIVPISIKQWRVFELGTIAQIKSGRDIYAQERMAGDTPYITSTASNNGIGYFVGNDNTSRTKNAISVNRNGAVGEAFYHPYEALYGNDCRQINPTSSIGWASKMFLAFCISQQKKAFSYSRKLGTARLKKLKIMLPVNDQGQPDYAYMEQYTKNMMYKKYQQYLEFLDLYQPD